MLVAVGLNQRCADVSDRERLATSGDALEAALAAYAGLDGELTAVLGRALQIAKRVRTETALGRAGVSWGHAAVALAGKILGPLRGRPVAVLGAGEMARLTAQHLADQGAAVVVLNRTLARGEALAREVGGIARPLEALGDELRRADVVVSAAPIAPDAFGPEAIAATMRARRLDAMAGSIVAKLLHAPSTCLRRAVCDGGAGEALVAAAARIFDLPPDRRTGAA